MSSLSAFLLNYYAPPPKLRISLKVIVGLFVLCDCPITLAILDMEALRAGKEAIVQSASGKESRPKGCVRPPPQDDWFFIRCYLLLLQGAPVYTVHDNFITTALYLFPFL